MRDERKQGAGKEDAAVFITLNFDSRLNVRNN